MTTSHEPQPAISLESGDWDSLRGEAAVIRFGVFVIEQEVPEDLELDMLDPLCRHWIARDSRGEAIATARLTADNHVGRMAVVPDYRGKGVGAALLEAIKQHALETGIEELALNAQLQAIPFYEKLGFTASGPVFDDAGIQHRTMHWRSALETTAG